MTRTIVTGGAGFLGSHLADELTARGHEVLIFDQRASPFLQSAQEQVVGDLLDFDLLRRTLQGADYVYHLGALADLNAARSQPRETASINVLGSVNLLEAARLAAVASAVGVSMSLGAAMLVFSAANLVAVAALIPGGIGVTELTMAAAAALVTGLRPGAPTAAAIVLLDRLLSYYLIVGIGAVVLAASARGGEVLPNQ